jgi:prolyl oligopeptidase
MVAVNVQSDPVVEIIHGVAVADPYRWLEDRNDPATGEWIAEQRHRHDRYFASLPGLDSVRARVRDYLNREVVEQPTRIGSQCFFRRRSKDQEQSSIWVRNTQTGIEKVLVDPSTDGPFASVVIHRISDDGRLLAYELRHGGEKAAAIHFVDVGCSRILADHLDTGYPRGLAFLSDKTGFCYCHETADDIDRGRPHEIRCPGIGLPAGSDRVLFSTPRVGRSRMVLLSDDRYLGALLAHEVNGTMCSDLYRASRLADTQWKAVFVDRPAPYGAFFRDGRMFVQSCAGAPNGHILLLNEDGSEGREVVPEWEAPIRNLLLFGNKIFVTYQIDLETIIRVWSLDGVFLGTLPTPKGGSFALLRSYSNHSETLFSTYESFHRPPAILEFDEAHQARRPWASNGDTDTCDPYEIQRVNYHSEDGTDIPMYLVQSRIAKAAAVRPTILTAYGGFGACMTPRFSVLVAIMLELGAVFALPNIRGGGEFGKSWHEAAIGRRRQTAYDDFIRAAEWLCNQRITTAEKLAIFGGSNSGLLVGAAMTQRPQLFRAVLCLAPILDMVRYEHFGDARKWKSEYGTVDDPEDFRALYAYSPYHRVSDSVNYPATLFVCGDKDTVCDPAHTQKMVARLQERRAQRNSILVDHSSERGHTAVLPLSVRIDALTRRVAFLCRELGITTQKEPHS